MISQLYVSPFHIILLYLQSLIQDNVVPLDRLDAPFLNRSVAEVKAMVQPVLMPLKVSLSVTLIFRQIYPHPLKVCRSGAQNSSNTCSGQKCGQRWGGACITAAGLLHFNGAWESNGREGASFALLIELPLFPMALLESLTSICRFCWKYSMGSWEKLHWAGRNLGQRTFWKRRAPHRRGRSSDMAAIEDG
jgi:hypothetical protein